MRLPTASLCSSLAIATALMFPGEARAQSFLGDGTVVKGSANIQQNPPIFLIPPTTVVTVNSQQAVINWSATGPTSGGVQTFQNAGTEAIFQNGRGISDYAVLNRILPGESGARVSINGIINSYIGNSTGGTVFFYSPNGIIIGSTAQIDVGRLGLTTSDPWDGTSDTWLNGNQVTFRQALAGSSIDVQSGAAISALTEGSYVAMVAPVINHAGSIQVNGQAALVAAEASTITFNPNGLFDIQVTVGSGGAGEKISSSGTITGPASSGAGDNHRIYMVAVPKNDAISIALTGGGTLGFDVAGAAEVDGNAIVLSAGHTVSDGYARRDPANVASASASIFVRSTNVTSALHARASDSISLAVTSGLARYWSDVDLAAPGVISIFAQGKSALQIDGDLSADADRSVTGDGEDVTGGTIRLLAQNGGTVSVGGTVDLEADAFAGDGRTAGAQAGDAVGGTIEVATSNGGVIDIAGNLEIEADARGGDLRQLGGTAGSGTGGTISIHNSGTAGSITVEGSTYLQAQGYGGGPWDCSECGGNGGDGTGGTVLVAGGSGTGHTTTLNGLTVDVLGRGGLPAAGTAGTGTGGTVTLSALGSELSLGDTDIYAQGIGGFVFSETGSGNIGKGGTVKVLATAGSIAAGDLLVVANGFGSRSFFGGNGGDGTGGTVELTAEGGSIDLSGGLDVSANGYGGLAQNGGNVGSGTGGNITIDAFGGALFSVADLAELEADGLLALGDGECVTCSGTGGTGTGGTVRIGDKFGGENSIFFADSLLISASGTGSVGSSGDGGLGSGGTVALTAQTGTRFEVAGDLDIDAVGSGGGQDNGGTAGAGKGGKIDVYSLELPVEGIGFLIGGDLDLNAGGRGGASYNRSGGTGGSGTGGETNVVAQNGSLSIGGNLTMNSTGRGGNAFDGTGGDGSGDRAVLAATLGGGISIFGTALIDTSGIGGSGATGGAGTGGAASRGSRLITDVGAMGILGAVTVRSEGRGGAGYLNGGAGSGGLALVSMAQDGDVLQLGALTVDADGIGGGAPLFDFAGFGTFALPEGGDGVGGNAVISVAGGDLLAPSLVATAAGTGGDMAGGIGGDGTGKFASIQALNGGTIQVGGAATADASGTGGDGIVGGTGRGGGVFGEDGSPQADGAEILAKGGNISVTGLATVAAAGTGGKGSDGPAGSGGAGVGGWASVIATNSDSGISLISLGSAMVDASGVGGRGGDGNPGIEGGIGGEGRGGSAAILGSAGNGQVRVIGAATLLATGTGGSGGAGGYGDVEQEAVEADGGAGGAGTGGTVTFGTASGADEAVELALGSARFGSVVADASAVGGAGGIGGFGEGDANGGGGGDAVGGRATLLVRGSPVVIDGSTTMLANATGGDGGFGTGLGGIPGVGGDASLRPEGQAINLIVTERNGGSARGKLTAGAVNASAAALASPAAISTSTGGNGLTVRNSDAAFDSLSIVIGAVQQQPVVVADFVSVTNGTVTADSFSFESSVGEMSLFVDNGLVDVGTLTLSALDFVPDADEPPTVVGLIKTQTADITTGNNFYTTANMEIVNPFTLVAPGSITIANLTGGSSLDLTAQGGSIQLGNVVSGGGTTLQASSSVTALDFNVEGFLSVTADNAFIQGNSVVAGGMLFEAEGDIDTDDIESSGSAVLMSNSGSIDTGNVTADGMIVASAPGAVTMGNLTTAGVVPEPDPEYDINIQSGTSIDSGTINSQGGVNLVSAGTIDVGSIDVATDILLLADGDIVTGPITGSAASDLLIGDDSMAGAGGPIESFNAAAVLGAGPVSSSGGTTINGAIDIGGDARAFVGGGFTAGGAIQAANLTVRSGALAQFDGAVTSGSIDVASTDLQLGASGSLTATGLLQLISTNAAGTTIGDGVSGSGYALSNEEFGKLQGGDIVVGAAVSSAAQDMVIGQLDITGDQIGGEGTLAFFTFDQSESNSPGVIRVSGNVAATGFNLDQTIAFSTGVFQLDTATGSVGISGSGGAVSGYLEIDANRVHVADTAILAKLEADPLYAGREAELNAPSTVQRPEGVLKAYDITVYDASQVLVQNTGTNVVQAGIVAADGDIIGEGEGQQQVELIINGQIATEGGTITGIPVWEAVVTDPDFTPELFTPNSSINGCLLTATSCGVQPEPEPRPVDPPRPDLTFDVEPPLVDKLFTKEEDPCEGSPAGLLVNDCGLLSDRLIEEPVTGSGNPALIGGEEGKQ